MFHCIYGLKTLFFLVQSYGKLPFITVLLCRTGIVLVGFAANMMYLLWLNVIPGLNCTSLGSELIATHYHTPSQREVKLKPGINLNYNIYMRLHEFGC